MAHISHYYLFVPFLMKNILNNGKIWHMVRDFIYYVSTIDFFKYVFIKILSGRLGLLSDVILVGSGMQD